MGDIVDHRGNTLPAPGNGRAKRPRIDKNHNEAVEDLYFYPQSTATATTSARSLLTGSEVRTTAGAASLTLPITMIRKSGGAIQTTLANGTFVGQRKTFINTLTEANTLAVTTLLGPKSPLTFRLAGDSVQLMWINDGTTSGWVIIGSSIHHETGSLITNAKSAIEDTA